MFKKAVRADARLRMALIGPSGAGKTYTALSIAKGLGGPVAVIDTERGSASKYSGNLFDFDVLELTSFAPERYVEGIKAASDAGYGVLIIDSLSHAWNGKDGLLEFVDKEAARNPRNNSFGAWRNATPKHNLLVDAMLGANLHVIVTMRAKTEYVQEKDERGKTTVRKVGLAPVQRDGLEYEFDVVCDLDQDNNLIVTKSRCPELSGEIVNKAGVQVAETLKGWLTGVEAQKDASSQPARPTADPQATRPVQPAWERWRKTEDAVLWAADQADADGTELFSHINHAQNSFSKARDEYGNSLTNAEKPKPDDTREQKWAHAQALFRYFYERIEAKKRGETLLLPTAGSQPIFEAFGADESVGVEALTHN